MIEMICVGVVRAVRIPHDRLMIHHPYFEGMILVRVVIIDIQASANNYLLTPPYPISSAYAAGQYDKVP